MAKWDGGSNVSLGRERSDVDGNGLGVALVRLIKPCAQEPTEYEHLDRFTVK